MVVVNLVYGLTLPLLSLVLDAQGVSSTVIGASILVQAAGGVLLAHWMPPLILRVGPAAIMQRSTLAAAALLLLLGVIQNVWLWFPLRFLLGASAALLWSASEVLVNELAEEIPYYSERHSVKPGVTGWAQLRFTYVASKSETREKLRYDLYYVKNHSLVLDLMIILQTAEVILWGKGAR